MLGSRRVIATLLVRLLAHALLKDVIIHRHIRIYLAQEVRIKPEFQLLLLLLAVMILIALIFRWLRARILCKAGLGCVEDVA